MTSLRIFFLNLQLRNGWLENSRWSNYVKHDVRNAFAEITPHETNKYNITWQQGLSTIHRFFKNLICFGQINYAFHVNSFWCTTGNDSDRVQIKTTITHQIQHRHSSIQMYERELWGKEAQATRLKRDVINQICKCVQDIYTESSKSDQIKREK